MSSAQHDESAKARALEVERSINERYQRELEALVERAPKMKHAVGAAASASWTGTAPRTAVSPAVVAPIEGRVGFRHPVDGLGTSFYVGGLWGAQWQGADGEIVVVSWAAPVAGLFFLGAMAADDRADEVGGTRTFEVVGGAIRGFEDDLLPGVSTPEEVFPLPGLGHPAVPAAPRRVERPATSRPANSGSGSGSSQSDPPVGSDRSPKTNPESASPPARQHSAERSEPDRDTDDDAGLGARAREVPAAAGAVGPSVSGLRAPAAVRAALDRPRAAGLGAVLATLQPDQYELVTRDPDRPLVIQGQPGTGKTIVATHRAAYLTHVDRKPGQLRKVAVVGPSPEWARHISPSLQALGAERVVVIDLPRFLSDWANTADAGLPGREARVDTEWALGRFFREAVNLLNIRDTGRGTIRKAVDQITGQPPQLELLIARNPDLGPWLREARSYENMTRYRRYLPALASVGVALGRKPAERFEHLIVDEAQDLRPLEWRIVQMLLEEHASVTLLGDLNQRRSDWTHDNWLSLAVDLELTDDDGSIAVEELSVGYRSTARILRFAGQLLPRGQRSARAIREGTDPTVARVVPGELDSEVVSTARALAARHRSGRVAIITMNPRSCNDLLRGATGWRRMSGELNIWEHEDMKIVVTHPDRARGLEFDAVVVVEPKSFPTNLGRDGVLYTSLTRATQELAVVHSKGLPRDLRQPRR